MSPERSGAASAGGKQFPNKERFFRCCKTLHLSVAGIVNFLLGSGLLILNSSSELFTSDAPRRGGSVDGLGFESSGPVPWPLIRMCPTTRLCAYHASLHSTSSLPSCMLWAVLAVLSTEFGPILGNVVNNVHPLTRVSTITETVFAAHLLVAASAKILIA